MHLLFFKMDKHQPFCTKPFYNQSQCLTKLVLVWENSLPTGKKYKVVMCMLKICSGNIHTFVHVDLWERDEQSRLVDISSWPQKCKTLARGFSEAQAPL